VSGRLFGRADLAKSLPLAEGELRAVLENRAPWLE